MENAKKVADVTNTVVSAVDKEQKYEAMVLKEEMQREQYEEAQMKAAYEKELDREACLERAKKAKAAADKEK